MNASDDVFSKSVVNVSPTDLKLSCLVTVTSVVVAAAPLAAVAAFTVGAVVVKFAIFD